MVADPIRTTLTRAGDTLAMRDSAPRRKTGQVRQTRQVCKTWNKAATPSANSAGMAGYMAPGCAVSARGSAGGTHQRTMPKLRPQPHKPMSGHAVASNDGRSTGGQGKERICSRKGVLGRAESPVDVSLLVARLPCSKKTEPHEPSSSPGAYKAQQLDELEPQRAESPRPPDRTASMS